MLLLSLMTCKNAYGHCDCDYGYDFKVRNDNHTGRDANVDIYGDGDDDIHAFRFHITRGPANWRGCSCGCHAAAGPSIAGPSLTDATIIRYIICMTSGFIHQCIQGHCDDYEYRHGCPKEIAAFAYVYRYGDDNKALDAKGEKTTPLQEVGPLVIHIIY